MPAMHCSEFLEFLEPWMDGERRPDAEAHLHACPRCQGLVGDLEAIHAAGRRLAEVEAEPPARVWTALRAQMEEEGILHRRSWNESWSDLFAKLVPAMPRLVVAGAGLLAFLVAAGLLLTSQRFFRTNDSRWFDHMQATTVPLHDALGNAEEHTVSAISDSNPAVSSSLHQNLVIVDKYIRLCEKSVREEPQNEVARDYLYDAYQQKAELLNDMSERGVNGR